MRDSGRVHGGVDYLQLALGMVQGAVRRAHTAGNADSLPAAVHPNPTAPAVLRQLY